MGSKDLAIPHRLNRRTPYPKDSDLWGIDNRRESPATDGTQTADREHSALHIIGLKLFISGAFGQSRHLCCQLPNRLFIHVADHRHNQTGGRVHCHANVAVMLHHQCVAVICEGRFELGVVAQGNGTGFENKRQRRQANTAIRRLGFQLAAKALHITDVSVVKLCDVGYVEPGAHHVGGGDLVDSGARNALNCTIAGKVLFRNGRQTRTRRGSAVAQRARHVLLQILFKNSPPGAGAANLAQRYAELARQLAHRRPGINLIRTRLLWGGRIGWAGPGRHRSGESLRLCGRIIPRPGLTHGAIRGSRIKLLGSRCLGCLAHLEPCNHGSLRYRGARVGQPSRENAGGWRGHFHRRFI